MSDDRRRALDELAADAQALGEYEEPRPNVVVLDCPFCGAAAEHTRWRTGCWVCQAWIFSQDDRQHLTMWNRRVVVGGKPEAPGT